MSTKRPFSSSGPRDSIHEALRRDAARIPEPPFDAALHHAGMRRIRALAAPSRRQTVRWWRPALAGALGASALCVALGIPGGSRTVSHRPPPDFTALAASTRSAMAALSSGHASPIPAWMSPSASLLGQPNSALPN
ncbi:MAG: hypothetical protein WC003_01790 [Terrimicrobiaceae bacterium]